MTVITHQILEESMSQKPMNKEKWVSLFRAIGLSDAQMAQWHKEFEGNYPEGHQSFLEWLGISEQEIKQIRSI